MSGWSLSPSISVWRRRRWRLLSGFLLKHLDQLVQVSDDELGAMKAIGSVQANAQQSINDQVGGDAISLHPLSRELQLGIWINHPHLSLHSSAPFHRCHQCRQRAQDILL